MLHFFRYLSLIVLVSFGLESAAQKTTWKEMHKVKKKETIYGIARDNGITVEELVQANPEMATPGYKLKKGDYIFIPYPQNQAPVNVNSQNVSQLAVATPKTVKVGVMLPLHNVDGDGRRMVEFYRGILMACQDLKKEGINVDVHAWNVNIDADINQTLSQQGADKLDIIFGPLYTKQVKALGNFATQHNIKVVIPWSISGNDVATNPNIFQVYQSPDMLNQAAINAFIDKFSQCHTVIIDCNDKESKKGVFTFGIRREMDNRGMSYSISNLESSDEVFVKCFSLEKPNVVVLNTGRSPELTAAMKKLDALTASNQHLKVSLFGYTDWLLYERYNYERFCKYDTYVPTYFYFNASLPKVQQLERDYFNYFGVSMQESQPRFALTGYDQAMFFLRGIHSAGQRFTGEQADKSAVQTQYRFVKASNNGGWQNRQFMLVHYNTNRSISTVVY